MHTGIQGDGAPNQCTSSQVVRRRRAEPLQVSAPDTKLHLINHPPQPSPQHPLHNIPKTQEHHKKRRPRAAYSLIQKYMRAPLRKGMGDRAQLPPLEENTPKHPYKIITLLYYKNYHHKSSLFLSQHNGVFSP